MGVCSAVRSWLVTWTAAQDEVGVRLVLLCLHVTVNVDSSSREGQDQDAGLPLSGEGKGLPQDSE